MGLRYVPPHLTVSRDTYVMAGNGEGSQTSTLESTSGDSITWSTTYTWSENENDVKSCECCIASMHEENNALTLSFSFLRC